MATSHREWYWDGAWHPYPKNKQPLVVLTTPIPEAFQSLELERIGTLYGVPLYMRGEIGEEEQGSTSGDNRTSRLHMPPQKPT